MEKPILFNTEMVQAILEGRKTQTRRIIKQKYDNTHIEWFTNKYGTRLVEMQNNVEGETFGKNPDGTSWQKLLGYRELKPPYQVGDILYVRETWQITSMANYDKKAKFLFKAKPNETLKEVFLSSDRYEDLIKYSYKNGWQPSLFMPKEAARILLKVTDVKVERLQDMSFEDMFCEGIKAVPGTIQSYPREKFEPIWDSTIKKQNLDLYGWNANPWVWVIEFEKVEGR